MNAEREKPFAIRGLPRHEREREREIKCMVKHKCTRHGRVDCFLLYIRIESCVHIASADAYLLFRSL